MRPDSLEVYGPTGIHEPTGNYVNLSISIYNVKPVKQLKLKR
jgi:hypothetical protein